MILTAEWSLRPKESINGLVDPPLLHPEPKMINVYIFLLGHLIFLFYREQYLDLSCVAVKYLIRFIMHCEVIR